MEKDPDAKTQREIAETKRNLEVSIIWNIWEGVGHSPNAVQSQVRGWNCEDKRTTRWNKDSLRGIGKVGNGILWKHRNGYTLRIVHAVFCSQSVYRSWEQYPLVYSLFGKLEIPMKGLLQRKVKDLRPPKQVVLRRSRGNGQTTGAIPVF